MATSVFVSDRHGVIDSSSVPSLVSSLPVLGRGVSRKVFDLGDVVLKVNTGGNNCGSNESEFALWEIVKDSEYRTYFAEVFAIADDGSWMIAEKAFKTFESCSFDEKFEAMPWQEWNDIEREIRTTYHVGDLHDANVAIRENGSILIIDYAMNPENGKVSGVVGWSDMNEDQTCHCEECRHAYNNPDGCTDHDCNQCFPDGDPCAPFEGCHEEYCDYGSCVENAMTKHVRKTEFGIHNVSMILCHRHATPKPGAAAHDSNQLQLFGGITFALLQLADLL